MGPTASFYAERHRSQHGGSDERATAAMPRMGPPAQAKLYCQTATAGGRCRTSGEGASIAARDRKLQTIFRVRRERDNSPAAVSRRLSATISFAAAASHDAARHRATSTGVGTWLELMLREPQRAGRTVSVSLAALLG